MAVRFDASNEHFTASSGLPGSIGTYTLWEYLDTNPTQQAGALSLGGGGRFNALLVDPGPFLFAMSEDGSNYPDLVYAGTTTGAWYGIGVSWNGTSASWVRVNQAGQIQETGSSSAWLPPTTASSLLLGALYWATARFFPGRLAAVKMWNARLSQAEMQAELGQYAPVRTANLLRSHPFIDSPADTSGNGHALTAGSSAVSWEAGPDIPLGGSVEIEVDATRAVARATRPTLSHHTVVQVRDARATSRAGAVTVTQQQPLQVAAVDTQTGATRPELDQTHPVTTAAARAATRATTPTLTQHTVLDVAAARAATTTTAVDLTAPLLVDGARATTAAPRPVLGHTSPVTADDAQAATTAGSVELEQRSVLTVTDARAATTTDRPLLVGDADLVVHEARATTTATGPLLAAPAILGVHHARTATRTAGVLLEQTHPLLRVDDARAPTSATAASVAPRALLTVHPARAATTATRALTVHEIPLVVWQARASSRATTVLFEAALIGAAVRTPSTVHVVEHAVAVWVQPQSGRVVHR